jgi:hypothetical protein
MGDQSLTEMDSELGVGPQSLTVARLLLHIRKPENLLTWLVLTAWMKWMGIAEHIPSITIG